MSLRLRLTLLTGLLTGATLVLFGVIFYQVFQTSLRRQIDTQLQTRAQLLAHALGTTVPITSPPLTLPVPFEEFDEPGIYAELMAADGTVRNASPNLPNGQLPLDPLALAAAHAGASLQGTATISDSDKLRFLALPTNRQPGELLIVAESLEPLHRTLQWTQGLLFVGVLGGLLLASGGATLLTGRALAPMRQITHIATEVAATEQYGTRIPQSPYADEIGQLAATMNILIATIERTLSQQRQFLADTSHELRSPLTVVLANLHLLRRNLPPHERELSIQEATAEAQRMRRLVNDLLLLAQADAAHVIAHVPVRLDQVLTDTLVTIERQAPAHPIQKHIEVPVEVIGDAERLTQLVRNLLENATQHTPSGTAITVCLQHLDRTVELTVADTGPGISAEHLPRIWERFYRIDKMRSRAAGSSGLGLAIVKYIAEAHGGTVTVHSSDGGTTFVVQLPQSISEAGQERLG